MSVNVTTTDRTAELLANLEKLAKLDVLVGIPEEESSRPGEQITNAELMFIHTNGSPIRNIPARPVIEPAIEDTENREQIMTELNKVATDAMDGNMDAAMADLNNAGMVAQNVVRDWFTNSKNNWSPNSPLTIARKGSDRPMIDTGELRSKISYVVREKD